MPTRASFLRTVSLRFPGAQSCCFVKLTQLESGERTQAGKREDSRTGKKPAESWASSAGSGSVPGRGGEGRGLPQPSRAPPPATRGAAASGRPGLASRRFPPPRARPRGAICADAPHHTRPLVRTKIRNLGNEKRQTGAGGKAGAAAPGPGAHPGGRSGTEDTRECAHGRARGRVCAGTRGARAARGRVRVSAGEGWAGVRERAAPAALGCGPGPHARDPVTCTHPPPQVTPESPGTRRAARGTSVASEL